MMNPQSNFSASTLFQSMNEDLNASLATADSLSQEFNSLLQECSPMMDSKPQLSVSRTEDGPQKVPETTYSSSASRAYSTSVSRSSEPNKHSGDFSVTYSAPLVLPPTCLSLTSSWGGSGQLTPPGQSPRSQRRSSPTRSPTYNSHTLPPRDSSAYTEWSPSPTPKVVIADLRHTLQPSAHAHFDTGRMRDRSPSPRPFGQPSSSTLPRSFAPLRSADEVSPRQKGPTHWNETDLDVSYERKPHHTYDKSEWLRPSVPNSSWKESNLDASPPVSKKLQPTYSSLSRSAWLPPERPPSLHVSHGPSQYSSQPIISRISIPPAGMQPRRSRPIPLSVIMRLQNPRYNMGYMRRPRGPQGEGGSGGQYQPPLPFPQEYLPQLASLRERQPDVYGEALGHGDIDAELERLDLSRAQAVQNSSASESSEEKRGEGEPEAVPRPLSPTRLQPIVAPEAVEVPDRQEILRIRAEIPRALKRRGSSDQALPLEKAQIQPANQYKQMINKLLRRKGNQKVHQKGEPESESGSSSSEGEESPALPPPAVAPCSSLQDLQEHKARGVFSDPHGPDSSAFLFCVPGQGLNSILRRSSRERRSTGRRARLSPLVLLLDGALVGELETVQRAVQEMSDPSQPNDEGITALHNAICGGHYAVVDFLVRIGANVSAPDSHSWTPLHCAASCNDLPLCEYLVRSGAAVMAITESDGATASQKCDPFAPGFEECESFLRGVEEAMGVENSGVLYGLWGYTAQALDELSFREGDMVTILQKPEQGEWWWASLCGREGFVPNNYFGLFPKVHPKSLC